MPAPLVSVIIIFLNPGNFLREAIQSVLEQTYDHWELLLVDDGSTDESITTARDFAERYPGKIQYLEHKDHQNLGMSASRNLGIRSSHGDLVAFLDADDVWFPQALQEQVAILLEHGEAAMVYGPLTWWYSWTEQPEDQKRDYIEKLGVPADTLIEPPRLLPLFLLDKAAVPSGLLLRRTAIDRVGGFENEFRGEYEDQVFCAKICLSLPVFASRRSWYRYRQHPNSSVSLGQIAGQTYPARILFLDWLVRYLRRQRNRNISVRWAVLYELWRAKYPGQYRRIDRIRHFTFRVRYRWAQLRSVFINGS